MLLLIRRSSINRLPGKNGLRFGPVFCKTMNQKKITPPPVKRRSHIRGSTLIKESLLPLVSACNVSKRVPLLFPSQNRLPDALHSLRARGCFQPMTSPLCEPSETATLSVLCLFFLLFSSASASAKVHVLSVEKRRCAYSYIIQLSPVCQHESSDGSAI